MKDMVEVMVVCKWLCEQWLEYIAQHKATASLAFGLCHYKEHRFNAQYRAACEEIRRLFDARA